MVISEKNMEACGENCASTGSISPISECRSYVGIVSKSSVSVLSLASFDTVTATLATFVGISNSDVLTGFSQEAGHNPSHLQV